MARYGLYSPTTRDFLTHGGRVLTHTSRPEMEFLFPGSVVREVPPSIPADQCLPLPLHPALASTSFPLDRREFVHAS